MAYHLLIKYGVRSGMEQSIEMAYYLIKHGWKEQKYRSAWSWLISGMHHSTVEVAYHLSSS